MTWYLSNFHDEIKWSNVYFIKLYFNDTVRGILFKFSFLKFTPQKLFYGYQKSVNVPRRKVTTELAILA